jgi:hypothetical protein
MIGMCVAASNSGRYVGNACAWRISASARPTPVRWKRGGTRLGYQTHYVVDGGKRRIILAALVTPREVMENQPMLDLVWHTRFR